MKYELELFQERAERLYAEFEDQMMMKIPSLISLTFSPYSIEDQHENQKENRDSNHELIGEYWNRISIKKGQYDTVQRLKSMKS